MLWWKKNKKIYLLISRFAKRIFGIPASSAPSKREFSIAGQALEERRINLADKKVDEILFSHSLFNDFQMLYMRLMYGLKLCDMYSDLCIIIHRSVILLFCTE